MGNYISIHRRVRNCRLQYSAEYQPSRNEREVLSSNPAESGENLLNQFRNYHDFRSEIIVLQTYDCDEAISTYNQTRENVVFMSSLYNYCCQATDHFNSLASYMINAEIDVNMGTIYRNKVVTQKIIYYLAQFFTFDEIKMNTPNMLLDLSFYRRTTQRNVANALLDSLYVQTNTISIFLGASTPFFDYLYSQFNHTFSNNVPKAVKLLGLITEVCASNIVNYGMNEPCLKAMAAMILLIDKMNGNAFNARAPFPAYRCLQILFESTPRQENLINTIRYNSKNLNNEDTLEPIKELFAS